MHVLVVVLHLLFAIVVGKGRHLIAAVSGRGGNLEEEGQVLVRLRQEALLH